MKVLFAASEAVPFSKTGGLADVAGTLPEALRRAGADVSLFVPAYRGSSGFDLKSTGYGGGIMAGGKLWEYRVLDDGRGDYFIECPELFHRDELYGTGAGDYSDNPLRFSFFCRAVIESAANMGIGPDVVHVHDWQTALIPVYLKSTHRDSLPGSATILSIHNLGYQGLFPPSSVLDTGMPLELYDNGTLEFYGQLNFLKAGIIAADAVSTVSRTYASEIMTPGMGFGLDGVLRDRADSLTGIVNGLDYGEWDPAVDSLIPSRYDASDLGGKKDSKRAFSAVAGFDDSERPLAGVVSRLAHQKGIDLVAEAGRKMVRMGLNVAVLGKGDPGLEKALGELSRELKGAFHVSLLYDEKTAHGIYAASDIFLMPSRYEPCGLSQLISMKYGTIPVARATGGIADTVSDYSGSGSGTGFVFSGDTAADMLESLGRALEVFRDSAAWSRLVRRAMGEEFSWDSSASKYMELYQRTISRVRGG